MPALEPHNIKYLVVHCSDTDEMDIEGIHNMHLGFGWEGVGYHKVICRDGTVRNGRPEFWQGAHVKGRNESSLGVCLIGRNSFNDAQFKSLITILSDWKSRYSSAQIVGHRDIQDTDKTCPNFDVSKWCKKENIFYNLKKIMYSCQDWRDYNVHCASINFIIAKHLNKKNTCKLPLFTGDFMNEICADYNTEVYNNKKYYIIVECKVSR